MFRIVFKSLAVVIVSIFALSFFGSTASFAAPVTPNFAKITLENKIPGDNREFSLCLGKVKYLPGTNTIDSNVSLVYTAPDKVVNGIKIYKITDFSTPQDTYIDNYILINDNIGTICPTVKLDQQNPKVAIATRHLVKPGFNLQFVATHNLQTYKPVVKEVAAPSTCPANNPECIIPNTPSYLDYSDPSNNDLNICLNGKIITKDNTKKLPVFPTSSEVGYTNNRGECPKNIDTPELNTDFDVKANNFKYVLTRELNTTTALVPAFTCESIPFAELTLSSVDTDPITELPKPTVVTSNSSRTNNAQPQSIKIKTLSAVDNSLIRTGGEAANYNPLFIVGLISILTTVSYLVFKK
jgi:hypothetical protein